MPCRRMPSSAATFLAHVLGCRGVENLVTVELCPPHTRALSRSPLGVGIGIGIGIEGSPDSMPIPIPTPDAEAILPLPRAREILPGLLRILRAKA